MLHSNLWFLFPLRILPAVKWAILQLFWVNSKYNVQQVQWAILQLFWVNTKCALGTLINCNFRWKVSLAGGEWLNILIVQQTYQWTQGVGKKGSLFFFSSQLVFKSILLLRVMSVKEFWSPNLTSNNLKGTCNAHCIRPYKQPRILPAYALPSHSISPWRLKGF